MKLMQDRQISIGRLIINIHVPILLCVLLSVSMFINLGFWQLSRAAEKRQMQRDAQEQMLADPVSLESLVPQVIESPAIGVQIADANWSLNNRRVSLQGEYLNNAPFLVVFQFFQGQPGFELISPFRLASDSSLVLVSRGWIAPGPGADSIPTVQAVAGEQNLLGQIHVPLEPTTVSQIEERAWPIRLRRMHVPQAEQLLGEALFPYVVRLDAGSPGLGARHWPTVNISTRSNIGYALQWFFFALATLFISLLMSSNVIQLWKEKSNSGATNGTTNGTTTNTE